MKQSHPAGYGLIVAAGRGRRFGAAKQFAPVCGRPLLYYSLRAFDQCRAVRAYVVVTNRSRVGWVRRQAGHWHLRKLTAVVPGGPERRDSVAAGLAALPDSGLVAVHDGARPLVTAEMLLQGFAALRRCRAALFASPVTDTLKRARRGRATATGERAGLFCAQTPQFFAIRLLRRAHASAGRSDPAPDDAALVERLGVKPLLLAGPRHNIKVTAPGDLAVCRKLLCGARG